MSIEKLFPLLKYVHWRAVPCSPIDCRVATPYTTGPFRVWLVALPLQKHPLVSAKKNVLARHSQSPPPNEPIGKISDGTDLSGRTYSSRNTSSGFRPRIR